MNLNRLIETAYALMPKYRGDMRCFHVAGIYKKGRLYSIGFNKDQTHPLTQKYGYHRLAHVHAELSSILRGGLEDYSGFTMAILRIDRNNKLNSSRPCFGCTNLIKQVGLRRVLYTNQFGQWEEMDWNIPAYNNYKVETESANQ